MGKENMKALKWQILDEYNRIRDLEGGYKRYSKVRIDESTHKLKQLTKLYEPRNNKFINHIIAQFNRGCICYPIEESEFDELPKCMYKFTMFGDTRVDMKPYRYFIVAYCNDSICNHVKCMQEYDAEVSSVEIPSQVFDGNRIWRSQTVGSIFEDFVEELEPDRPSENGTEEWNKEGSL